MNNPWDTDHVTFRIYRDRIEWRAVAFNGEVTTGSDPVADRADRGVVFHALCVAFGGCSTEVVRGAGLIPGGFHN